MKKKIKIRYQNNTKEIEFKTRDYDGFKAGLNYKSVIYKNKKKYNRKGKYKDSYDSFFFLKNSLKYILY